MRINCGVWFDEMIGSKVVFMHGSRAAHPWLYGAFLKTYF